MIRAVGTRRRIVAWRRQPQVTAIGQSDPLPRTLHGQGSGSRQRFGVNPPRLGPDQAADCGVGPLGDAVGLHRGGWQHGGRSAVRTGYCPGAAEPGGVVTALRGRLRDGCAGDARSCGEHRGFLPVSAVGDVGLRSGVAAVVAAGVGGETNRKSSARPAQDEAEVPEEVVRGLE
jgi:hypothetical protein